MVSEGAGRENRIYTIVAIFVIVVIILVVIFSSNKLTNAIIEDSILGDIWGEDISARDSGSGLLGLEKWASFTYKNYNESYPAYVTVTSYKTLFLINEEDLKNKMEETIALASDQGIIIDKETRISGERTINNSHKTMYVTYDGNDTTGDINESIKIIGETWNCGVSGSSVICIGFAQITDYSHSNSNTNLFFWKEIIGDSQATFGLDFIKNNGLLFNVKCH